MKSLPFDTEVRLAVIGATSAGAVLGHRVIGGTFGSPLGAGLLGGFIRGMWLNPGSVDGTVAGMIKFKWPCAIRFGLLTMLANAVLGTPSNGAVAINGFAAGMSELMVPEPLEEGL